MTVPQLTSKLVFKEKNHNRLSLHCNFLFSIFHNDGTSNLLSVIVSTDLLASGEIQHSRVEIGRSQVGVEPSSFSLLKLFGDLTFQISLASKFLPWPIRAAAVALYHLISPHP